MIKQPPVVAQQEQLVNSEMIAVTRNGEAHWIYLSRVQRVHAQVKAVAELLMRFLFRVLLASKALGRPREFARQQKN